MTSRLLNRRQARWSMFLSEFNFILDYAPGLKNPADAPSRRADFAPREGDDVLRANEQGLLTPYHTQNIFPPTLRRPRPHRSRSARSRNSRSTTRPSKNVTNTRSEKTPSGATLSRATIPALRWTVTLCSTRVYFSFRSRYILTSFVLDTIPRPQVIPAADALSASFNATTPGPASRLTCAAT